MDHSAVISQCQLTTFDVAEDVLVFVANACQFRPGKSVIDKTKIILPIIMQHNKIEVNTQ
jgi:hypothetical protein